MYNSKLEEISKIKLAQQGNLTANKELLEKYAKLVINMVKRYFNNHVIFSNNELFKAGIRGLKEAIIKFNTKETEYFVDYANICIYNAIVKYISKSARYVFPNVVEEPLVIMPREESNNTCNKYEEPKEEIKIYNKTSPEEQELLSKQRQIRSILNVLTNREARYILSLKLGLEDDGIKYTDIEIASIVGIEQSQISIIVDKSLDYINSVFDFIRENVGIIKK